MAKTAIIRARTEPGLKKSVDEILHTLGLNESEAINIFFRQIEITRSIPFKINIPNETTIKTLEKTRKDIEVHKFKTKDEIFDSLGI